MTKRRMPWIELACLALVVVAWLLTRLAPGTSRPQPQAPTAVPAEEPAVPRALSIRGVKLDMKREEVDALFGVTPSAAEWRSYPENTFVSYGQGRVHTMNGNQLEKDGSAILREGDPFPVVLKQLGEPRTRDDYGCVYVTERSILRIGLSSRQGYSNRELEAADPVVYSFQLKRI